MSRSAPGRSRRRSAGRFRSSSRVSADSSPHPAHGFAARELAAGRPLSALSSLAAREDPESRALRGIALAQLGEFADARRLLESAVREFTRLGKPAERALALAAAGEVAAAQRDFDAAERWLAAAASDLRSIGDRRNAAWTLLVHARVLALAGDGPGARARLHAAEREWPVRADSTLGAGRALAHAETRLRSLDTTGAARSLGGRPNAACAPAIAREIEALSAALRATWVLARCPSVSREPFALDALELARVISGDSAALAAHARARRHFLVDRVASRCFFAGGVGVSLRRRPVLSALVRELASAWPRAVPWREIARRVFDLDVDDDSLRARAKVEIDRLRRVLPRGARIVAERNAWRLSLPRDAAPVILDGGAGAGLPGLVAALLADAAPWSVRVLSRASGASPSSVLRALRSLAIEGRVAASGAGRARRYVSLAPSGIASQMLLVGMSRPARG